MSPTVKGMKHFGVTKGVISRAIVRFSSPPEPHPLTACFHFPGTFLSHKYVLDMLRSELKPLPDAKVTVIQFVDRNCVHGTRGRPNVPHCIRLCGCIYGSLFVKCHYTRIHADSRSVGRSAWVGCSSQSVCLCFIVCPEHKSPKCSKLV